MDKTKELDLSKNIGFEENDIKHLSDLWTQKTDLEDTIKNSVAQKELNEVKKEIAKFNKELRKRVNENKIDGFEEGKDIGFLIDANTRIEVTKKTLDKVSTIEVITQRFESLEEEMLTKQEAISILEDEVFEIPKTNIKIVKF